MFPLRDVHRPSRAPIVSRLLVLLLLSAFVWQIVEASRGGEPELVRQWGARPRCVVWPGECGISLAALESRPLQVLGSWLGPLWSASFLHATPLHLALNVWFLWVFGPGVEDRLGRIKYLGFYLLCALGASLAHVAAQPTSLAPMIGASGAIAGVLGAHLILLPRSWILSFIPPIWIVPIPSLVFLALWIATQVLEARSLLPVDFGGAKASVEGVAWAAHVGGFVLGALCAWRARPWWKRKKPAAST